MMLAFSTYSSVPFNRNPQKIEIKPRRFSAAFIVALAKTWVTCDLPFVC